MNAPAAYKRNDVLAGKRYEKVFNILKRANQYDDPV
jgi:hypothetical protein